MAESGDGRSASAAEFYDDRWRGFQYANRLKCQRAAAILEALAETRLKEPRILDFGCGAGWLTNILAMFGPTTGIELSPVAIEAARARFPHASFYAGDARQWSPGGLFDVVVSQEVLEHFERHEEFFETVAGLLRPGGVLILTTPNAATLAAISADAGTSLSQQPIENPPTRLQLRMASSKHFRILRLATIIAGHGNRTLRYRVFNSKTVWRLLDRIAGRGAGALLATRLGLGLHFLLVAERR